MFLTDVKNALEVDRRRARRGGAGLARGADGARAPAGLRGVPAPGFIDDYLRITRRARRAMERVFSEEGTTSELNDRWR